jgi:hypothetical protein
VRLVSNEILQIVSGWKLKGDLAFKNLRKALRFGAECQSKSKYRMASRIKFETE